MSKKNAFHKFYKNCLLSSTKKKNILQKHPHLILYMSENTNIHVLNKRKQNNAKDKRIIKKIIKRIKCMRHLFQNTKPLNLFICLTDYVKTIPPSKKLNADNVNSGCTLLYPNNENGEIYIWRREEVMKVLLHELIHAFRVEDSWNNNDMKKNAEAYVECLALWMNILFFLEEHKSPSLKDSELLFLEAERRFSRKQARKIRNCHPGSTNAHLYITHKLNIMPRWKSSGLLRLNSSSLESCLECLRPDGLRFTITDFLLRSDFELGNIKQ